MTIEGLLDRRVPLALVAALLLQASSAVWWAASRDSDMRFQQARITHMEETEAQTKEAQSQALERLARIEERVNAMSAVLDRMEKQAPFNTQLGRR